MTWTRRELFIGAAAGGTALLANGSRPARARPPVRRWRGTALGAHAEIAIVHDDPQKADVLIDRAREEVHRLEQIFSLHLPDSTLSRLNALGRLENPPFELLDLLSTTRTIHAATDGAFDPTIQPLWSLLAETPQATPEAVKNAMACVGHDRVEMSPRRIAFGGDGMALTLNGVAQGYITDRVTMIFREEGLGCLVSLGEQRAIGKSPDGDAWHARVRAPGGEDLGDMPLNDAALAVSSPDALRLGRRGHILDPRTGDTPDEAQTSAVAASSAALADGCSTAFSIMERTQCDAAAAELGVQIVV